MDDWKIQDINPETITYSENPAYIWAALIFRRARRDNLTLPEDFWEQVEKFAAYCAEKVDFNPV